jgi:serine/threonine-protein kinase
MSPEQARGEPLDARSDLFALGVVMYEMATRQVPFPGSTSALAYVQLLHHAPELVRDWNDSIPKDLEKVILKLLAKDPACRYQSASELSDELARMTAKASEGWLKRAAVPLVRVPDPVAREQRPVRPPSSTKPASWPEAGNRAGDSAEGPGTGQGTASHPEVYPGNELPRAERPVSGKNAKRSASGSLWRETTEVVPPAEAPSSGKLPAVVAAATKSGVSATRTAPPLPSTLAESDPVLAVLRSRDRIAAKAAAEPQAPSISPPAPGRLSRRSRRQQLFAAAVLLPAIVAVLFFLGRGRFLHPAVFNPSDQLLLTTINNTTGDATLDGTISEALAIDLAESPYLFLRGAGAYRAAVRQLGGVADQPQTAAVARQAALAIGAKGYLYGICRRTGGGYTLSVEVLDTATNRSIAGVVESVAGREQLPAAVDRVAKAIRTDLGEPAASLGSATANVPLEREATANLGALHAFALGQEAEHAGRADDAFAFYQSASELDPKFVEAQTELSWLARARHEEQASAEAARLAVASAGATSSHTRPLAQFAFEMNANGDLTRAEGLIRQFVVLYPRDPRGAEGLARVLRLQGHLPESLEVAQKGIAIEPYDAGLYAQAELSLIGLNRYDVALDLERQSEKLALAHDELTLTAAYLAGKVDTLESTIERITRPPRRLSSMAAYGLYLDNIGQLGAGATVWTGVAIPSTAAQSPGLNGGSGWLLAQGAIDRALAGECGSALDMARLSASTAQGSSALFNGGTAAALCGDPTLAATAVAKLTQNLPHDSTVADYYLPNLKAAALQVNDPAAALETLKQAQGLDHMQLTAYLRGLAHLSLHQPQLAVADFAVVLDHRGLALLDGGTVYPMAQVGIARAYANSGDVDNSVQAYRKFLALWTGASEDQPLKLEAIAAIARH